MSESLIDQPVATSSDRIAALTEALRNVAPLTGLTDEEYQWLASKRRGALCRRERYRL